MSPLTDLDRWIAPLGGALLHFLWQGVAIAAFAWATMTLARSPRLRYAVGCAAMALMLACPIATLAWIGPDAPRAAAPTIAPPLIASTATDARIAREPVRASPAPTPTIAPPSLRDRLAPHASTLVIAWLVGVAAVATFHAVGLARVARLRRTGAPILDESWQRRVRALSDRLGLRRAVALRATTCLDCPAVVGAIRPIVLWPAAALTGLTPTQVDALLAHELAHVARHDYLVNLLQTLVETLLFYHPAVWWLSRQVRAAREHCCDDLAAAAIGDRVAYAGALAAMERLRATPSPALGANDGPLLARVRRLVAPTPAIGVGRLSLAIQLLTLGLIVAVLLLMRSRGDANATKADAPLRPGDRVTLSLFDAAADSRRTIACVVADDGSIDVPPHGSVRVDGLLPRDVPRAIDTAAAGSQVQTNVTLDAIERGDGHASATRPTTRPDYRIAPGDLLRIEITDLAATGINSAFIKRVSGAGQITAPYLNSLRVVGLTEIEAEQLLRKTYRDGQILTGANVSILAVQRADGVTVPAELFGTPPLRAEPTRVAEARPPSDKVAAGDLLRLRIYDLTGPGVPTTVLKRVAADGTISLLHLKKGLSVAGQTTAEVERTISAAYQKAQVISNGIVEALVIQFADGRPAVPDAALAEPAAARDDGERRRQQDAIDALKREVETLKRDAARPKVGAGSTEGDPFVARLVQTRDDVELELTRLRSTQGNGSPAVQKMEANLAALDERIRTIREAMRAAVADPATLRPPATQPDATSRPGAADRAATTRESAAD